MVSHAQQEQAFVQWGMVQVCYMHCIFACYSSCHVHWMVFLWNVQPHSRIKWTVMLGTILLGFKINSIPVCWWWLWACNEWKHILFPSWSYLSILWALPCAHTGRNRSVVSSNVFWESWKTSSVDICHAAYSSWASNCPWFIWPGNFFGIEIVHAAMQLMVMCFVFSFTHKDGAWPAVCVPCKLKGLCCRVCKQQCWSQGSNWPGR